MPELPEVETVRRSLKKHLIGKAIKQLEVLHKKTVGNNSKIVSELKGQKISAIERRGKLLMFNFKKLNKTLLIHLKMTGQLIYCKKTAKAGQPAEAQRETRAQAGGGHTLTEKDLNLPNNHTRAVLHFSDGSKLFFNDLRLFGYLKLVSPKQLEDVLSQFGIEPGTKAFTREAFEKIFKNKKTNIKALLLNQKVIAGLGNIYADELCFSAKIKPTRRVNKVTKAERDLLYKNCQRIIKEAIAYGGTTFYSFINTDGKKGSYLDKLKVFKRQGKKCLRCKGSVIKKIKHAGRGTHFCSGCQK